jgi:putative ABC transport system permease protein
MLGDMWRNLRYGARALLKNSGFTAMAVLTLALGIGSTTAIFSVVYATLFEAMPYPKPDQLMMVWTMTPNGRGATSVADYLEWKRRSESFQYIEAWTGDPLTSPLRNDPNRSTACTIRPAFFV